VSSLIVRPFQPLFASEVEAVYTLIDAATRNDWTHRLLHDTLRNVVNPHSTTALALLGDRPVGFIWWEAQAESLIFEGWVDPAQRRRGVGTALLVYVEQVAREKGVKSIRATTYSDNPGAQALYKLRGYESIRPFDQMWVDLPGTMFDSKLPLPSGISIAHYSEKWLPALADAEHDAFSQHWGRRPGQGNPEQIRRRIDEILNFNPEWFWLATDGDLVASFVLSHPSPLNGKPDDAWVWHVGTRHDYQRKGIARALLHRALARLQRDGFTRAGLHVDSENPGAVALYQSVGMHRTRQRLHYQKTL
jgi:mycothiol synthase